MRVPHVIFAVSSVNKNIAKNDWLSAAQIHAKTNKRRNKYFNQRSIIIYY